MTASSVHTLVLLFLIYPLLELRYLVDCRQVLLLAPLPLPQHPELVGLRVDVPPPGQRGGGEDGEVPQVAVAVQTGIMLLFPMY